MDNLYYIPEIEEFHVGFEFEYANSRKWTKCNVEIYFDFFESLVEDIVSEKIRVKYLDRQDIENCGFIFTGSENSDILWFRNKSEIKLTFHKDVVKIFDEFNLPVFSGKIRNKSELKKLLKQIEL